MMNALCHRLSRLKRSSDGVVALEFAFVAPVLFLLILGSMEMGWIFFGNSLLEGGLREAARFGLTGAPPPSGTREDHVVAVVNQHGAGVIQIVPADITTLVYPNFVNIGEPEPHTEQSSPPNNMYDPGEPYVDINCNGNWDPDMGKAGLGSGGEVVLYTVQYDLPMITGFLASFIGQDGKFPLMASVAVRNEPFDAGDPGC